MLVKSQHVFAFPIRECLLFRWLITLHFEFRHLCKLRSVLFLFNTHFESSWAKQKQYLHISTSFSWDPTASSDALENDIPPIETSLKIMILTQNCSVSNYVIFRTKSRISLLFCNGSYNLGWWLYSLSILLLVTLNISKRKATEKYFPLYFPMLLHWRGKRSSTWISKRMPIAQEKKMLIPTLSFKELNPCRPCQLTVSPQ